MTLASAYRFCIILSPTRSYGKGKFDEINCMLLKITRKRAFSFTGLGKIRSGFH